MPAARADGLPHLAIERLRVTPVDANQSTSNTVLVRIDATGPAYVQPHAVPPSYPSAAVDPGVVLFASGVVALVAALAVFAVVMERRRARRRPPSEREGSEEKRP